MGNPGDRYAETRHNAGFRVVESLAARERIRIRSRESGARVGRGSIEGTPVLLALPQTYMNASGEAVRALCQKNGIDPSDLCVVSDDIDLPLGTMRMRPRGSAGGQKGLASIISN
ncbi:MAG: aminoacyl-tRNA hydrolase, partial [Thermoanaerobaculia bacterium]